MARVALRGLCKTYGARPPLVALHDVSLDLESGASLAILGPSGCGKTTLLRIVAGLERPDAGAVLLDDTDVLALPAARRYIAFVFATDALFPHLSVFGNIAYGIPARLPRREVVRRVTELAERMRIPALLERRPGALSGGERQRVALARALAMEPRLLLLDEPFSRLDARLRVELRLEFAQLRRERSLTTLFVTHDQSEALALGDRVAVVRDGILEQIGTPREIYARPASAFVGAFVGTPAMAFVPCESFDRALPRGSTAGFRAEAVRIVRGGAIHDERAPEAGALHGVVRSVEDAGDVAFAYVTLPFGDVVARVDPADAPQPGDRARVELDLAQAHFFRPDGARLPGGIRV